MSYPIMFDLPERSAKPARRTEDEKRKNEPKAARRERGEERNEREDGDMSEVLQMAREKRAAREQDSARAKESPRVSGRGDLENELAMLLGGRRQKYAADMIYGQDSPWRNTVPNHSLVTGHGAQTVSEEFTEPDDASFARNPEEAFLIRERDRLDPYGDPTHKMQVQDAARDRIVSEYFGRRGRR